MAEIPPSPSRLGRGTGDIKNDAGVSLRMTKEQKDFLETAFEKSRYRSLNSMITELALKGAKEILDSED
jgi:uncharacterized protein (DUF1778 family)